MNESGGNTLNWLSNPHGWDMQATRFFSAVMGGGPALAPLSTSIGSERAHLFFSLAGTRY
nr:hypothetical protein Q903MT_gene5974 [Picea sitchensis]